MSEQTPAYSDAMQELAKSLATPDAPKRIVPSVGIHENVPIEVYHNLWDAASNSALSILKAQSPAHLFARRMSAPKETEALRLGHAMHSAILEPDLFTKNFVVAGQCEATKKGDGTRCTNQGIAVAAVGWVCGVHAKGQPLVVQTATVLSASDYRICLNTRDAVHRHAKAHRLLTEQSRKELSIVWEDRDTGLLCKARIDCHSPLIAGGTIVDPKSTIDASPTGFAASIYKHGYHRQGALYLEGSEAVQLPAIHFCNVAIEKEPPYAVVIYRLHENAILRGANELRPLKALYARCLASGEWPGYSTDVVDLDLPEWAAKKIDGETREDLP